MYIVLRDTSRMKMPHMSYPTLYYRNPCFIIYNYRVAASLSGDDRKTVIGRNCGIRIFDCYSSSSCNNSKFLSFYIAYFSIWMLLLLHYLRLSKQSLGKLYCSRRVQKHRVLELGCMVEYVSTLRILPIACVNLYTVVFVVKITLIR